MTEIIEVMQQDIIEVNSPVIALDVLVPSVPTVEVTPLELEVTENSGLQIFDVYTQGHYDPTYNPNNPLHSNLVPDVPGAFVAVGDTSSIRLAWNAATYFNHEYTEIWRSATDDRASALRVAVSQINAHTDPVDPANTYYYWIRFVSKKPVIGPWNGVAGTPVTTNTSATDLLKHLEDSINETQLAIDLRTRLNKLETNASAIAQETLDRGAAMLAEIAARDGAIGVAVATEVSDRTAAITTAIGAESAAQDTALAAEATTRFNAITGIDGRVTTTEGSIASNLSSITSLQADILLLSLQAFDVNTTYVVGDFFQFANNRWEVIAVQTPPNATPPNVTYYIDHGLASSDQADIAANAAAISAMNVEVTANTSNVTANATSLTGLTTTVGTHTATIATQATSINGLETQYSVKLDVSSGHVAGFGLSNTASTGTPGSFSQFVILADRFAILHPSATDDAAGRLAFSVENSVTVMDGANIKSATISTAKITDLSVITAKIGSLAVTDAKIANLAVTNAKIGSLAVTEAKIGTAAITNAKIGSLAVTEAKIGSAAVTNAKIGTASITNVKIGTAAVETLKIAGNAVTVPVFYRNDALYTTAGMTVAASCTVVTGGGKVLINFSAYGSVNGTVSSDVDYAGTLTMYIYRGATLLYSRVAHASLNNSVKDGPMSVIFEDAPASGMYTYHIKTQVNYELSGNMKVQYRNLHVSSVKR